MEVFTVTSTGRLIKWALEGFEEFDGSSFGPVKGSLFGSELDTRDEACDFNDFASALRYWESLSDSNN